MDRLPKTRQTSDSGLVYVVKRGNAYKVGFSRANLSRRVASAQGRLVLTIRTGARPGVLESLIHQRFAEKRTEGPGSKREWFALDGADLDWLSGLSCFMDENVQQTPDITPYSRTPV